MAVKPKNRDYKLKDGTRVPGVTTVIGLLGENKRALIHAAWKLGYEGKDYREVWGKGRDAGTLAHALAELHVRGESIPDGFWAGVPGDVEEEARLRHEAFLEWLDQVHWELLASEIPLVSESFRCGGTLDAVGLARGQATLLDLKSKTLYVDQVIQVAAYQEMWNEAHPEAPVKKVHILGMSEGFHHHLITPRNLKNGLAAFTALRQVYGLLDEIET